MTFELLLEWASERGGGRIDLYRQTHDWLINRDRQRRLPPAVTLQTLSRLSHIEVDWRRGTWAAAPPVLTILPDAGGIALLTGARTRTLVQELDRETSPEVTMNVVWHRRAQYEAPDAIYLSINDESDIEQLAERLRIAYEYSVADRLSRALPHMESILEIARSTPPPGGFEVMTLAIENLKWHGVQSLSGAGLYEFILPGRSEYRFYDGDTFYATDRPTGIYAELRRQDRHVLVYKPEPRNGSLIVPLDAPLPVLQARAAAMCSGLDAAPIFSDRIRRFVNVPLVVARRIAASLGQELHV